MLSRSFLLLAILSSALFAFGEDVVEIDLSTKVAKESYTITFCVRHSSEKSRKGDAFVVFENSAVDGNAKFDGAFGREQDKDTDYLGVLSETRVDEIRSEEHDPATQAFIVHVDSEAYQKARLYLEEYGAKDRFDYSHEIELTDFTHKIVTALGLYPPYRAAFRTQYVVDYYTDLTKLNRKM